MMEIIPRLIFFILLLITALVVGSILEQRHFRSIREREARLKHIRIYTDRRPPSHFSGQPFYLVSGAVVISSDYFKTIVARLKSLIGGRLTTYETLLERGRREAILRMKEQAEQYGAKAIFNVRLETSMLNQNTKKSIICSELLAYGTAFKAPLVSSRYIRK